MVQDLRHFQILQSTIVDDSLLKDFTDRIETFDLGILDLIVLRLALEIN